MIDGATCWTPAIAQHIAHNKYLILENDFFDQEDTSVLPEFIPGDTVEVIEHLFSGKTKGLLAMSLVSSSNNPKRKLFEFLFKAAKHTLPIDAETKRDYSQQIQFIRERRLGGEFYYPTILDTIKKLEVL